MTTRRTPQATPHVRDALDALAAEAPARRSSVRLPRPFMAAVIGVVFLGAVASTLTRSLLVVGSPQEGEEATLPKGDAPLLAMRALRVAMEGSDPNLLSSAFARAMVATAGVKRESGEPLLDHSTISVVSARLAAMQSLGGGQRDGQAAPADAAAALPPPRTTAAPTSPTVAPPTTAVPSSPPPTSPPAAAVEATAPPPTIIMRTAATTTTAAARPPTPEGGARAAVVPPPPCSGFDCAKPPLSRVGRSVATALTAEGASLAAALNEQHQHPQQRQARRGRRRCGAPGAPVDVQTFAAAPNGCVDPPRLEASGGGFACSRFAYTSLIAPGSASRSKHFGYLAGTLVQAAALRKLGSCADFVALVLMHNDDPGLGEAGRPRLRPGDEEALVAHGVKVRYVQAFFEPAQESLRRAMTFTQVMFAKAPVEIPQRRTLF